MHSLYLFADQLPHGVDILMGKEFQMRLPERAEEDETGMGDQEEYEEGEEETV